MSSSRRVGCLGGQCIRLFLLAACAAVLGVCGPAAALVVRPNTTGHDSAPTGTRGWNHVGQLSTGTGVYLGYGWVLTAYHVYDDVVGQSIKLNGVTYNEVTPSSGVRLENPNKSNADLVLFRISGDPGLSAMPIRQTSASVGADVTVIGAGRTQASSTTTWYVDTTPDPWVWSESQFTGWDATAVGFKTTSTRTKMWGTNQVADPYSGQAAHIFRTHFTSNVNDDAQCVTGDSGGGMFIYNSTSGQWELAGIMYSVGHYSGQPNPDSGDPITTAVYGNFTYAYDLSYYRTQIMNTIPEPATALLVLGGLGWLVARRRRR